MRIWRKTTLLILGGVIACVATLTVGTQSAYADNREPWNRAENNAKWLCLFVGPLSDRRGAIWLGNGQYYDDNVTINADNNSTVQIAIRGSVYGCGNSSISGTAASNVTPQGPNAWRLSGMTSNYLYRGQSQGASNWSTQGNDIYAQLNVSGLATTGNPYVDRYEDIVIGLYRCFYNTTTGVTGECYTEEVTVHVRRLAKVPTVHYTLDSANCDYVSGWTFDSDNVNAELNMHFYFGPTEASLVNPDWRVNPSFDLSYGGDGVNRVLRPDVVNHPPHLVYNLNHNVRYGFKFPVPDEIKNVYQEWWVRPVVWSVDGYTWWFGSSKKLSDSPCIKYNLVPKATVGVSPSGSNTDTTYPVLNGDTATFKTFVNNTGPSTSNNVWWKVIGFVVPAGSSTTLVEHKGVTNAVSDDIKSMFSPEAQMVSGQSRWDFLRNSATGGNFPGNANTLTDPGTFTLSTDGLNTGDLLCVAIIVAPWGTANVGYDASYPNYVSKPACAIVGKTPQMQIRGADSWSGGYFPEENIAGLNTSCTVSDALRRGGFKGTKAPASGTPGYGQGSWSQYGLTALGDITTFGSAGYTNSGSLEDRLKFRNSTTAYGNFMTSAAHCISGNPSAYARYRPLAATTTLTGAQQPKDLGNGVFYYQGSVTINGFEMPKGQRTTLIVEGDVTINGDITYPASYANIDEIPSFTLIAYRPAVESNKGMISVGSNVKQIDGVYIAYRKFVSCSASADKVPDTSALTDNGACREGLTINGAVITRDQILRRTAGGGRTDRTAPSEIFNYRPDMFLAPYASSSAGAYQVHTMSERELPARY